MNTSDEKVDYTEMAIQSRLDGKIIGYFMLNQKVIVH